MNITNKNVLYIFDDILKESGIKFYECSFHSNCNITINNNETNIYDLHEYIYSYSMNETINFNLMNLR